MAKQASYIKTINGYEIYKLNTAVDSIKTYNICENKIIIHSTQTLVEAETWANAN